MQARGFGPDGGDQVALELEIVVRSLRAGEALARDDVADGAADPSGQVVGDESAFV